MTSGIKTNRPHVKKPSEASNSLTNEEILSLPVNELLSRLGTSAAGLTEDAVAVRSETYGPNEVVVRTRASTPIRFLSHFKSPLTIILIIAAIISGVVGQPENAIIIFFIVMVSVVLDFFQEYRAEKAADELRKRVASTATTLRDGNKQDIEVSALVPGDIIFLSSGDIVPADARIMVARDLFIDQSALTGESFPAEKAADPIANAHNLDPGKWTDYLFMGTSVTNGAGTAVIVKTGGATQYGEIVKKSSERKPHTEFERGLTRFGYLIVQVTFALVILVFLINALFKHSILDSLLFAVALAVGLTPGLLPMILSINLARGASAMSKKGVIVKRMAAIQNFGSMDILCSDKTGTLTENRVTLVKHISFAGRESEKVLQFSYLNSRFQTGLRNPLDEAILKHEEINIADFQRVDEIPFDFIRRRLSVVASYQGNNLLITKGAPEEIARVTSQYEVDGKVYHLDDESRIKIEKQHRELSTQGFRVLSVAYLVEEKSKTSFTVHDEDKMIFLGFIAFMDPLKESAGESIELLRQSGVKLKILTGDNEVVAARISQQVGFQVSRYHRGRKYENAVGGFVSTLEVEPTNIARGAEIENATDEALQMIVERADIFTRVTPIQKNRIINALKANGHVVGFMGDGINDTPSMKVADVSISVANAVDIAKESAEIILVNNDLKVLRDGVIEGRKTFGNTMKYILMAISSNFGNMFSAAAASLFLSFLPMLPIQILLNNLLYSFAQLTLPSDNVDPEYIERPQTLVTSFIRNFMISFGPISSIFDFLTFFIMLQVFQAGPSLFQTAWFIESLFTQTLVIFSIRTRIVPFFKSKPSKILILNVVILLAFAISIPFIPLGKVFGFVALPTEFILILVGFIVVYFVLVELMKVWFYRRISPAPRSGRI
jgi:P-type Mg2+ transporter